MSSKGLLIASVLLALLAGGVWWSERARKAEEAKPAPAAAPKLVTLPETDVQRIAVRKKDAPPVVLERSGAEWKLTAPSALRADMSATSAILNAMINLNWDQLIDEKAADLSPFGLQTPAIEVELDGKGGKKQTLLVGDETPTTGSFYAKLAADPRVFTIGSFVKTAVDKGPGDLRDKRLLVFNDEKLSRIELTAKGNTLQLGKDAQGEWQILKPGPYRADGGAVEDLRRRLREAKLEDVATDFEEADRVITARVSDSAGTAQLQILKQNDKWYARNTEGTFKVASDLGPALDKGLADLRNKKLFDFGFSEPTRVEVNSTVFEKSGDTWMSAGKAMDSTGVQNLIDKLRDLTATSFPAGSVTPAITLSVTSPKRKEKVTISAANVAQREGEPSLYQLDAKAVEALTRAATDVKPAPPPKNK